MSNNPSINIPAEQIKGDWIEKNIHTMINQIMADARHKRPLPTSITCHGVALRKFIDILKSKSVYFPEEDGKFKFIGIQVFENNRLPYGTFTVKRFKRGIGLFK